MACSVGELLDYLATQPRDRPVIMAKDGEGNNNSPLDGFTEGMYLADDTYSGEVYVTPEQLAENIRDYPDAGWCEDDVAPDGAARVIVLSPVN